MEEKLILGKPIADQIKQSIKEEIEEYEKKGKERLNLLIF